MKFPLPSHPFRTVELTAAQCTDFEHVMDALLDETLGEYERFVHLENRTLHKKLWKPVKTRENLTVYKETTRGGTAPRALPAQISADAAVSLAANMNDWRLPKLLAVGSIVGTLDDVMYGVVAPDVKTMLLRSSYVSDELVDGGVLFHIKGAIPEDPFRFLGVKWLVKAHPAAINAVVSPRDTVVIDATGIRVMPTGDRVGYHTFHSVLLPECPELKTHSILRGHLSSCYLFKQMPNGTVEVYMKTYVDPGGRLSESLAVNSVANALVGCYKSVLCAQGKKLTWLIKQNAHERNKTKHASRRGGSDAPAAEEEKDHCCELCQTAFRSYKLARGCVACLRSVCSRCQMSRKISHMQKGLQVKQTSVVVCNDCNAQAAQLSALQVARDEFVGRQVHQHSLMTDNHSNSSDSESWTMSGTTLITEELAGQLSLSPSTTPGSQRQYTRTMSTERDRQILYPETTTAVTSYSPEQPMMRTNSFPTPPVGSSAGSYDDGNHRDQLLMQMNQLRLAAEQTYMITKQNESAMRFSPLLD